MPLTPTLARARSGSCFRKGNGKGTGKGTGDPTNHRSLTVAAQVPMSSV